MDNYVEVLIALALEKARVLRGKIKNPLPSAEFSGLQSRCEYQLDSISHRLRYLAEDPDVKAKGNSQRRIRLLRRAFDELALLECTGIAALNRIDQDDVFLSKVLFQIHKEINYPLNLPTVTCLSQSYYNVNPKIGLLSVPLAESESLLHLPDFYHELGHPVIYAIGDPKVEKFQEEYGKFIGFVLEIFNKRRIEITRSTAPKDYHMFEAKILELSWIKYWGMEFFCDLFAIYTLGPAYAWSHLHLTASRDGNPYDVKINQVTSHPPDQARMEVMLYALDLLGQQREATSIRDKWNSLLVMTGSKQSANYRKACPRELLELAAVHAFEGIKFIGCRLANERANGEIHKLLNEAWKIFWQDQSKYRSWEKTKLIELKQRFKE